MTLHDVGNIDLELSGPRVSVRRVLTAVVAVVVVVCASGLVLWQSQQVPVRQYRDVRVMAARIGCQDTFVPVESSAAMSAGRCLVNGSPIELRTFPDQRSAEAWHDGVVWASAQRPLAGIGPTYVFLGYDAAALSLVGEALG